MTSVWLATYDESYENSIVIGAFTTEELAMLAGAAFVSGDNSWRLAMNVHVWEEQVSSSLPDEPIDAKQLHEVEREHQHRHWLPGA